ncbi:15483_t:CDS:2 [Racocetra fulgida]|uniref:15483_t:CDS:1 n=1 Tax=Racocetra fulgida TaxID=60492 RepID=A0A9N8ZMW6_9GLOM|nr:15483_t:CDS:2 [Racocetra fulgida]
MDNQNLPEQEECASNSSKYSLQEYSGGSHKKKHRKHKSCYNKSHSNSPQQEYTSSPSNYSSQEEYNNSFCKGKWRGSLSLQKSDNKYHDLNKIKNELKKLSVEQENELSPQVLDHDFENNGAPSRESVEIIVTEETAISDNNKYIAVEITNETQEQTVTQNTLNSREVNDELFSV